MRVLLDPGLLLGAHEATKASSAFLQLLLVCQLCPILDKNRSNHLSHIFRSQTAWITVNTVLEPASERCMEVSASVGVGDGSGAVTSIYGPKKISLLRDYPRKKVLRLETRCLITPQN